MDDVKWRLWNKAPKGAQKQRILNELVRENTPLIHKFVDRWLKRSSIHIDRDDAMQAGLIGLLRAIKGHDPDCGTRFSTYCAFWVRHEVQTCLLHQTQLYHPKGTGMPYQQHRASEVIKAAFGREATAEELGVSEAQLEKWKSLVYHFVFIDGPQERVGDEGGFAVSPAARLQDAQPIADALLEEAERQQKLTRCLADLSEVERTVILEDGKGMPADIAASIKAEVIERLRTMFDDD